MGRILSMNATDWPYILGGCLCALVNGAIQPAFAVVFSEIISVSVVIQNVQHITKLRNGTQLKITKMFTKNVLIQNSSSLL